MPLQPVVAFQTDVGRTRPENEDWCSWLTAEMRGDPVDAPSVWVVADGASTYGTGRLAANLAVDAVLSAGWGAADPDPGRRLQAAVVTANRILVERAGDSSRGGLPHPATIVAAVLQGEMVWVVSIGDSRAYLLRGGTIRQITRDHTRAAEHVRAGRMRPEEARNHPDSRKLTHYLGQVADIRAESYTYQEPVRAGDRLILCTDGLTRHVLDDEILSIASAGEPAVATKSLVDLANQRGGSDNVTVGIVELVAVREAPKADVPRPSLRDLSAGRLAALQEIGQRITASLELDATLSSVLESLIEITRAERACIMLRDPETGELKFEIGRNVDANGAADDSGVSVNIVTSVFHEGKPILIGDASSDPRFNQFSSVVGHALRSVICAPLIVRGQSIGVVYVDNSLGASLFGEADRDLVTAFANIAAAAIENARLHERLAAQVREITAMKTSQDRLLRSVSSGIISVDPQGVITSCNRAAAEMLAVSQNQIEHRRLADVLPTRFMQALGAPFDGGGAEPGATIQGFEMAGILPGRGYVHFGHRLSPIFDDAGQTIGWVLVLEDHTERELLERDRRRATADRDQIKRIFENYMPPAIFQELVRQGPRSTGIGGDRRDLTIMFADIRGFTGLSERMEPEQVVEVLNAYLGAATEIVFEHRGTVDKFIGDAIMALFGAPVPIENHALQAVRAALAMQRRFAESPPHQGQRASFGIGINTGAGVVGTIGAPQLKSYTVIGDVVNVASRLQSEARANEVLITDDTFRLVAGHVETEELGSFYFKGRSAPVTMYKVTAVRP